MYKVKMMMQILQKEQKNFMTRDHVKIYVQAVQNLLKNI